MSCGLRRAVARAATFHPRQARQRGLCQHRAPVDATQLLPEAARKQGTHGAAGWVCIGLRAGLRSGVRSGLRAGLRSGVRSGARSAHWHVPWRAQLGAHQGAHQGAYWRVQLGAYWGARWGAQLVGCAAGGCTFRWGRPRAARCQPHTGVGCDEAGVWALAVIEPVFGLWR
eukprot:359666-Chlamydomonas_euryale.AAC.3